MNWIEQAYNYFGYKIIKIRKGRIPRKFMKQYKQDLEGLKKNSGKYRIYSEMRYDVGAHPFSYRDLECEFAALHLSRLRPSEILDVGSYRFFVIGVLSHFKTTTVDVRSRQAISENETVLTADVKKLPLPDNSFDTIVSLCALEHFGLGRYGDEVDWQADQKAFGEMQRVLKPGGHLIFTTTVTRAKPSVQFNTHRVYTLEMLHGFCSNLERVDERFYNHRGENFCSYEDVTDKPQAWNLYCGCWRKK